MKRADMTPSQASVLLGGAPCAPLTAEDVRHLTIVGKYGWPVSQLAADAAGREHTVLAIDLAGDDELAPIHAELAKLAGDKLAAAAKAYAETIGAEQILIAAPEGVDVPVEGAQVVRTPANPVLREESALYHMLDTGELRSAPLEKAFPSEGYRGLPTVPVDGETLLRLYAMTRPDYAPTKLTVVRRGGEDLLAEVRVGTPVGQLLGELGIDVKKPVLVGGVTGRFEAKPGDVAFTEDARFDSIACFGEKDCVVDATAKLLARAQAQSCEKCVLCREGTWHLAGIFSGITAGKGKKEDLDMVLDIGPLIRVGAFCAFGRGMADLAVSCVEACRDELEAHIVRKKCPAGVCAAFSKKVYCIDPKLCTGCGDCEDACQEMAIEGKKKFIYMIDQDMCTGCGDCADSCDEGAIVVNDGGIKLPKKLTKVGKFK